MHPPEPSAPDIGITARIGTAVWRLVVAACAFWGVYLIAFSPVLNWDNLWYFSQSGSLAAAAFYALSALVIVLPGGTRAEPVLAWLRGALATMLALICVTAIFILGGGDLDDTGFLLEHLVTPVVVAFDYIVVGGKQLRSRVWQPLTWFVLPLTYLIVVNNAGEAQGKYGGMIDPAGPEFLSYVAMFLVTTVALAYILFGLAKLRGLVTRGFRQPTLVASEYSPQPQYDSAVR